MPDAVGHMNPYRDTVRSYRKANWFGTVPLPHKAKHPPPTGFTGHRASYPNPDEIKAWCEDGKRHNIGIRLAGVDQEHEIIGIDVDHYLSGQKEKKGGDQLKELEDKLGVLPPTWISSARTDGISGIRYFRVPRGLAWRGQVAKDIECINKGYRFAVVYPSQHPDGGTYWWFPLGILPNSDGHSVWSGELPDAAQLPLLLDAWIEYLTQNKMRADSDDRIDMQSTPDELNKWADDTFHGVDDDMCALYENKVAKQKQDIIDEATSHDKIVKAHYNLIRLAAEGHVGLGAAINEVESVWAEDVIKRDKRSPDEVVAEVWRSRTNAFRKIKAQCDERVKIGAAPVDLRCDRDGGVCCTTAIDSGDPGDPLSDVPRGVIKPVGEYRLNDDGNADHFVNMYSSLAIGPAVRWVDGYGWIVWHDGEIPHWQLDQNGLQEMRRMFQRVRNEQERYVETALKPDLIAKITAFANQTPGTSKADVEAARALYKDWMIFARQNGNCRNAENAIKAVKTLPDVSMDINELDQNPYLLGVADGVIELDGEEVRHRKAMATDYITLNTGIPYEKPSEFALSKWQEYLDTFLPDQELQRTAQIALGHCLIGGNPEKIMIVLKGDPNTGKSTMVNAIETALGDYAMAVDQGLFKYSKFNSILASAINKRVVVCSEFDEEDKLSASQVKRLTGGTDRVISEIKFSMAQISGIPQFVPILATNEVPTIHGADKALQNRLYVIPFSITPKDIKKEYANIIKSICGPAILQWLLDGYIQYRRIGTLPMNKAVMDETSAFVSELDEIATFAHDALKKHSKLGEAIAWDADPGWCVNRAAMYKHFERWWAENNFQSNKIPSAIAFTKRLRALGYPGTPGREIRRIGSEANRWWFGVKLVKLTSGSKSNVFPMVVAPKSD